MNPQQQVLAWEWTETGYSFQYASNGNVIIEVDQYLASEVTRANNNVPGRVTIPLTDIDALERLLQKIKAIKQGRAIPAPSLFIAS